jgi:hypothetical protein
MGNHERTALLVAPERFVVEREESAVEPTDYRTALARSVRLRITWPSGPRAKPIPRLVFCAFWFGFLGVYYTVVVFLLHAPLFHLLFPLLHVSAGLALLYGALVALLNTTRLSLVEGVLAVRSGPVPVRGNLRVDASRIRQLFVTRKERRGRRETTITFELEAVVDGDRRLVVARGLGDLGEARYLEAVLEPALGIEPRPVLGEAT